MKETEKTLYVSDMDGTLMGADAHLSPETERILNLLISKGALVTVATARTPATVSSLLKNVTTNIPAIVMTGGALWTPGSGKYEEVQFFPEETVRQAIEIYKRRDMPTFMYTWEDNLIHMYHLGEMNQIERDFAAQRIGNPYKRAHFAPDEMPPRLDNVMLFFGMRPDNVTLPVLKELKKLPANPMFYYDMFGKENSILELFPLSCSKDQGIRRLMTRLGATRLVVFGDNMNDLPMMRIADCAVAVGNAIDEVKAQADIVIGNNTDDAVANFILRDFTKA